ncbi:MAG: hypothetical protein OXC92_08765 [Flavobacteriaceae bacterium]|nr:hypothetical protein [Flavobacteriaceae bacterium]MCY4217058.1 hypothetical protein [Flavobacteriaceae bacterium]MCY4253644.1 hypothetical protein [Flavobacteriaceae bacterium]
MKPFLTVYIGLFVFLWLVLLSHKTSAQEVQWTIKMDPLVEELIEFKIAQDKVLFADYHYTIQIGFGTLKDMNDLKEEFETQFPQMDVRLKFETPNYKLHVGKSRNPVLIHALLNEVKVHYPNAFVLQNT